MGGRRPFHEDTGFNGDDVTRSQEGAKIFTQIYDEACVDIRPDLGML
jgi:hypothetical protein